VVVHANAGLSGDEPPTNARVRRALNLLKPVLGAFVQQTLRAVPGSRIPRDADLQAILRTMLDNQGAFFSGRPGESLKHHVHLLRGARNWNAHDVVLDEREARQLIETVAIVAERIGAPPEVIHAVDALNAPTQASSAFPAEPFPPNGNPPQVTSIQAVAAPPASRTPRAEPRRDATGVVINAEELTADDVAMKRVLCPGCGTKVFEEWSAGWDAHAAYRCSGIQADSHEERKAEFRHRFGHLFRRPAKRR
jgi:hypothetical protein